MAKNKERKNARKTGKKARCAKNYQGIRQEYKKMFQGTRRQRMQGMFQETMQEILQENIWLKCNTQLGKEVCR